MTVNSLQNFMPRRFVSRVCAGAFTLIASCWVLAAPPRLELGQATVRREPPSGSGLARCAQRYYAVSDANGLLYTLDRTYRVTATQRLRPKREDDSWFGRRVDPDFESMACTTVDGQDWLIVLGSGHRSGISDSGHLLAPGQESSHRQRHIGSLYTQLAASAGLADGQSLNIEGLAVAGESAYIFSRSSLFFRVSLAELLAYLRSEREVLTTIEHHNVILPMIDGAQSAFSGAEYWPEADALLFTATVETRDDKQPKRKRMASALGVLPLKQLATPDPLDLRPQTVILRSPTKTLATKAESILINASTPSRVRGTLVSDNDDGKSVFRPFTLVWDASGAPTP